MEDTQNPIIVEDTLELNEESDENLIGSDSEERKNTRRLRIQCREDHRKKREAAVEGSDVDLFADENISTVEKQAAECAAILESLLADGEERITNIRVANDAREISRRFAEAEKRKQLLEKLEEEAASAHEKFNNISTRWNEIMKLNCPLEIETEINLQRERCGDLMQQKDTIIDELKDELKQAEQRFYSDLQKQLNDIKQLGERIDSQVILMKSAYRHQLELIEQSIELERMTVIGKNEASWTALFEQRNSDEVNNIDKKLNHIEEYKEKMKNLRSEHTERFRLNKMDVELEIQALQLALRELKTSCFINTEKIDYNYEILKHREEENLTIKSQQRSKLNKLQNTISDLKEKIKDLQTKRERSQIKEDKQFEYMDNALNELKSKADHTESVNERKYQRVWKMNQEKAENLIERINRIDRTIHEQILGVKWTPEMIVIPKLDSGYRIRVNIDERPSDDQCELTENVVRRITASIADSSGFLLEERLWPLMEGCDDTSRTLCKIDNIFQALNIESEDEIELLFKHFVKFCSCDCGRSDGAELTSGKLVCGVGHELNVKISDVLTVLQAFVKKFESNRAVKDTDSVSTVSQSLSTKDVTDFWGKYKNAYSEDRIKLWDSIAAGVNKYLPILQNRHRLNDEVTSLRKQNSELKNLLRGYALGMPKQRYLTPLN